MNHKFTVMDYAYIAKFYHHDGAKNMAVLFGISERGMINMYTQMRMRGDVKKFCEIWDKLDVNSKKELVK